MSISAVPWDDRSILKDRASIPTLVSSNCVIWTLCERSSDLCLSMKLGFSMNVHEGGVELV